MPRKSKEENQLAEDENQIVDNAEEDYSDDDNGEDVITASIRDAFEKATGEEKEEDDVKMQMISAGATFKNVTRLYNQFMIDFGMAMSKEDKEEIVSRIVSSKDVSTEEGFNEAAAEIEQEVKGANERSAAALVRGYAKKNDLEVYAKPKGQGAGKSGFASKYYDFLAANPAMSEDEAKAYVMGEGDHEDTSDNVQKHLSHYLGIWALVNKIYNSENQAKVA